jgi:pimeloyl-ACP methyl ester carboxylesterase
MNPSYVLLIAAVQLAVSAGGGTAAEAVTGFEHWVENGDIRLRLWEKRSGPTDGKPVVILAHGSSSPGEQSFDLQVPGKPTYSLMDALAGAGFNVFAPDVRGFGRSTKPPKGVTTAEAAEDFSAVIDYVCGLRGVDKVSVVAWSWGTQYAGLSVIAKADKVARYVSYAQMHGASPDIIRRGEKLYTYQKAPYLPVAEGDWKVRFSSMTPESTNDPAVIDAFAKAAAAVQAQTPTGPQIDMVTSLPIVNPRLINVPVLLIHGAHDDVADTAGLAPFFSSLPNPDKRYVVIPNAGHMMHLQAGHLRFQKALIGFLSE